MERSSLDLSVVLRKRGWRTFLVAIRQVVVGTNTGEDVLRSRQWHPVLTPQTQLGMSRLLVKKVKFLITKTQLEIGTVIVEM